MWNKSTLSWFNYFLNNHSKTAKHIKNTTPISSMRSLFDAGYRHTLRNSVKSAADNKSLRILHAIVL